MYVRSGWQESSRFRGQEGCLFYFLSFCSENPVTHLQQDGALVESKTVINTSLCSSAQNTVYTFQAKPTYLYVMLQCIQLLSSLPNTLFLLFVLSFHSFPIPSDFFILLPSFLRCLPVTYSFPSSFLSHILSSSGSLLFNT